MSEKLDDKADLINLLLQAPHKQGGHSKTGMAIARKLGVPFPISMENLAAKARENNLSPVALWPWYKPDKSKTK